MCSFIKTKSSLGRLFRKLYNVLTAREIGIRLMSGLAVEHRRLTLQNASRPQSACFLAFFVKCCNQVSKPLICPCPSQHTCQRKYQRTLGSFRQQQKTQSTLRCYNQRICGSQKLSNQVVQVLWQQYVRNRFPAKGIMKVIHNKETQSHLNVGWMDLWFPNSFRPDGSRACPSRIQSRHSAVWFQLFSQTITNPQRQCRIPMHHPDA